MTQSAPESGWIQTPRIRMHYLDWDGTSDKQHGPRETPVLALHGLASSCHWYNLVIPHLADAHRCIALDQRGHGQTDQPPGGYDWDSVAADAVDAMDVLGIEKSAVLGHSWGGYVALSIASKYPERVSSLVMIDGGFMDWTLWPGATWEWFSNLLKPRDVSGTREDFLSRLSHQLADCWSDQLEDIVMTMVKVGPDGMVRDILEHTSHAQVLEAMWNEPPSTMYPKVSCPTLIVAAGPRKEHANSEWTRMRREMADHARSAIQDCHVEWVAETVHDIGYHKPEPMAHLIRNFLSRA